jgi:hypothetical protein
VPHIARGDVVLDVADVVRQILVRVLVVAEEAVLGGDVLVEPDRVRVVAPEIPEGVDGLGGTNGTDAAAVPARKAICLA